MEQKKQVRIVPMSPEHLDEIAALEKVCFSAPWSRNMLAEELDNACSAFLTALDETGRVVGYAGLQVILDDRQKGVAAQLLQAFINFAKGNRLSFLTLEVRPSNTAAIVLYGHHGFRTAGRRKNYYELPREDALIMKLEFNYGTENGVASGTEGGL